MERVLASSDCFDLLDVGPPKCDVDEAVVLRQYKAISFLIHPDRCTHPQAKVAFQALQSAREVLLDAHLRHRHAADARQWRAAGGGTFAPSLPQCGYS